MSSDEKPTVKLTATLATDVGVVRDHNEDNGFTDPSHRFFIVADGMGGHAAGEVASAMAVDEVRKALSDSIDTLDAFAAAPSDDDRKEVVAILENAVRAAHQAVFSRGVKETDKQGMGTTLDVLLITGCEAFIAHVGDSRTYLLRDGKAAQITTDHTVAEVLVIEGKLSVEEAQASPLRTILVNAIGVSADVGVEISHVKLREGDRFLLCSDGLHDYFPSSEEIAEHLKEGDLAAKLAEMVELAKQRGGHDNITGIVVEVQQCVPVPEQEHTKPPQEMKSAGAEMSDGVPREIGQVDTMPVDTPADDSSSARGKQRPKDPTRETLPMGMEALTKGEPPPAAPDQSKAKGKGKGKDDAPIRKTEPMQTVAAPQGEPPPAAESSRASSDADADDADDAGKNENGDAA